MIGHGLRVEGGPDLRVRRALTVIGRTWQALSITRTIMRPTKDGETGHGRKAPHPSGSSE